MARRRWKPRCAHPPDLILTDVMMPKLDGYGLGPVQALRADPYLRENSGDFCYRRGPARKARIEGIAAGADDYLVKPFSANELLTRVETALRLRQVRRYRGARGKIDTVRGTVPRVCDRHIGRDLPNGARTGPKCGN